MFRRPDGKRQLANDREKKRVRSKVNRQETIQNILDEKKRSESLKLWILAMVFQRHQILISYLER